MAVVNVQEKWSGTGGRIVREDYLENYEVGLTRAWTVQLNDATTAVSDALGTSLIPSTGTVHPEVASAVAVHKRASVLGPTLLEVTLEYAGKNSPLTEPYERRWSTGSVQEPVNDDYNGNLVKNSAGDPFAGVTVEYNDMIYIVTRNEAVFPATTARAYLGPRPSISNDAYKDYAAGEAKMISIAGQSMIDSFVPYCRVTYQIQFRTGGWDLRLLDQGPTYKPSAGSTIRVPVRDRTGTENGRLHSDGTLLDPGDADEWLTFQMHPEKSFVALGLE